MKQIFPFLSLAFAVTFCASAQGCDTVQLPYSANYNQCWTPSGGAAVVDSTHITFTQNGQQAVGPWMDIEAGSLNYRATITHNPSAPNSSTVWFILMAEDGTELEYSGMSLWDSVVYFQMDHSVPTCRARFILMYGTEEQVPDLVTVSDFVIYESPLTVSLDGPSYAYTEDTVTFSIHSTMQDGYSAPFIGVELYDNGWNWVDTTMATILTDDTVYTVVFHTPGQYYFRVFAYVDNVYNGYAAETYTHLPVTIMEHVDCDSVSLPYIADFNQCWTAENGATIIDPGHAAVTSQGQKITSPWMESQPGRGFCFMRFERDDDPNWDADERVTVTIESQTYGVIYNYSDVPSNWTPNLSFNSPGGPIRISFEYTGTTPVPSFRISDVALVNYQMDVTIEAPETVYPGDTTTITAHFTMPDGEVPVYKSWYFYDEYWNSIGENDPRFEVVAMTDSSRTVVWNSTGTFRVEVYVNIYNILPGSDVYAYAYANAVIQVVDTTPVDCDNISLPYNADFTQCWTTGGGGAIINATTAQLGMAGSTLVGPLMNTEPGRTFIKWQTRRDDQTNYTDNEMYSVRLLTEDGAVLADYGYYAEDGYYNNTFISPGGRIRVVIEQTGSAYMPSFQVCNVTLFQYDIDLELDVPGMVMVGDTVTLTLNATLQNGDALDHNGMLMYDIPHYNQHHVLLPGESDATVTIVSQTDNSVTLVWNTAGWYAIDYYASKDGVFGNNTASVNYWSYVKVVNTHFYEEDSIYYTSERKDTVIGSHNMLHRALLPESVSVINDSSFYNRDKISQVSLPGGLVYIGKCAFAQSDGFSEITIPENVEIIDDNAFWSCLGLNTVNFNPTNCQAMSPTTAANGSYWPVFIGSVNIHTIIIGENVTHIPDRAFWGCNGLRGTLRIPDAVTYVGYDAFYHYDMTNTDSLEIIIGSSVSQIGNWAFYCHDHVSSITSRNTSVPVIDSATFLVFNHIPLIVPCGTRDDYMANAYWLEFETYGAGIIENCEGIEEAGDQWPVVSVAGGRIVIDGACGETVHIYDMMGRQYQPFTSHLSPFTLPTGIYMVRVGARPARKVVVIR